MSRPLRIEYAGAWYHVMNRGRRKEDIFWNIQDFTSFVEVLQEASDGWNLKIAAYCLMLNHYHLLVHTPDGNLSRCMRHINGVYTQRFNQNHKTDGQLFRGRYKAVLIENDSHLLEILRYIHRNPIRAGIVGKLRDHNWSSHQGYLSNNQKYEWLYKEFLLNMLSRRNDNQKTAYINFVSGKESEEVKKIYASKNIPSVFGNETFKEWVKEKFMHLQFTRDIPESRQLTPSSEKIVQLTCRYFGVAKEQMFISKRGQENLPRDIAIYLVRYHTQQTLVSIGILFEINNYSTVSSAVERIKTRLKEDEVIQKHLSVLGIKINKSQQQT